MFETNMWHPAHVDGSTLVVIRQKTSILGGYEAVESGVLEYDGEVLCLVGDRGSRVVTDSERDSLQPVVSGTGITACRGFVFFLLQAGSLPGVSE